jgi:hypothetical protein
MSMMNPIPRTAIFMMLALLASPASHAAERKGCMQPDIESFMEQSKGILRYPGDYFPSLDAMYLEQSNGRQIVQWMGAYWETPIGGALFALDCTGEKITGVELGGITEMRPGPWLSIGQTVEVEYVATTGTGIRVSKVALATLAGTSINILWSTEIDELIAFQEYDHRDKHRWTYSSDGKTITVTGQRIGTQRDSEHNWAPRTIHALPNQKFCWNDGAMIFSACK